MGTIKRNKPRRCGKYKEIQYKIDKNGCWVCTSHAHGGEGYPMIWVDGKHMTLHHFIYERFVGPVPKRMCVCHTCDNRRCIKQDHLWLGTHKENTQDAVRKGRIAYGEQHGKSKLTAEQVLTIKDLIKEGMKQRLIAERFDIDCTTVSNIHVGKTWRNVVPL